MAWAQVLENFQRVVTPLSVTTCKTHKRCLGCERLLPVSNFYSKSDGQRLVSRCKPCYIAHQKRKKRKS